MYSKEKIVEKNRILGLKHGAMIVVDTSENNKHSNRTLRNIIAEFNKRKTSFSSYSRRYGGNAKCAAVSKIMTANNDEAIGDADIVFEKIMNKFYGPSPEDYFSLIQILPILVKKIENRSSMFMQNYGVGCLSIDSYGNCVDKRYKLLVIGGQPLVNSIMDKYNQFNDKNGKNYFENKCVGLLSCELAYINGTRCKNRRNVKEDLAFCNGILPFSYIKSRAIVYKNETLRQGWYGKKIWPSLSVADYKTWFGYGDEYVYLDQDECNPLWYRRRT